MLPQQERGCSTCAGCLNPLNLQREQFVIALGQEWHSDCFRCSVCDAHLHNWYFEKEGLLFCRSDYYQRFGEACQQCGDVITGPVMVAGDHKFHPECFCCSACNAFIGDGESYALVERSKLYCGVCYKKQQTHSCQLTDGSNGTHQPLHSIRLVEIPREATPGLRLSVDNVSIQQRHYLDNGAVAGRCASVGSMTSFLHSNMAAGSCRGSGPIMLSSKSAVPMSNPITMRLDAPDNCPTVRISEFICRIYGRVGKYVFSFITSVIDQCCGAYRIDVNLANLHIGDRILEVNGTPISDSSIDHIDKLIRSTEKILQLTVEHDPIAVCRSCSQADILNVTQAAVAPPLATSASSVEVYARTSVTSTDGSTSNQEEKERLFKRKEEGNRARQLRKHKQHSQEATEAMGVSNICTIPFNQKERCSSMSKLLDEQQSAAHPAEEMYDLSRTKSFRVEPKPQRIFRASDLVLGELLGKGFFGQVYKVTHRLTKEVMVLKELYRVDEEAQRNFLKEVAVLRSLNHHNVLKFIGVLYKDKKLHLVTEYIPGGSLKELIHDSGLPLTWMERISFAKDIACGMNYLHSRNIIHRDLNSLNCLVRENRSVIVADFGLARIINSPLYSTDRRGSNSNQMTDSCGNGNGNGTLGRSKSRQRRQRYTVVGNPYWMAPEMMKGCKYDEKVDVFSFGIVQCEIIGRVQADPDFLPRTSDFGLNQKVFRETFCKQCPEVFYKIAFLCCDLNPDKRPSFDILELWLDSLLSNINTQIPQDLIFDVENFTGTSLSTTPDDLLTPKSTLSRDDLTECSTNNKTTVDEGDQAQCSVLLNLNDMKFEEKENNLLPLEIPKSPHLGKDFSPTGERIRNSMRARRRQRLIEAQHRGLTPDGNGADRVLEAVKQTLENGTHKKKIRPYGDKGFILNINREGDLRINNVRDLNNCSDFDSSCDTSLNYHEVNSLNDVFAKPEVKTVMEEEKEIVDNNKKVLQEDKSSLNTLQEIQKNIGKKSYRVALDDIRTKLNLCRNRFETIDEANRKNFSQSQHSMQTFFKIDPTEVVYRKPPDAFKMFERREKPASLPFTTTTTATTNTTTAKAANVVKKKSRDTLTQTYRINQTPIFERKINTKPMNIDTSLSESMENLCSEKNERRLAVKTEKTSDKRKSSKSPVKRSKSPLKEPRGSFRSYLRELEEERAQQAELLDVVEPLPKVVIDTSNKKNRIVAINAKEVNTSKRLIGNEKPKANTSNSRSFLGFRREVKSPTAPQGTTMRRTLSPTKSSEMRRAINKQETTTVHSISTSATSSTAASRSRKNVVSPPPKTPTNRLNILSPERIHRLNARLTEQKKHYQTTKTTTNNIPNVETERRKSATSRTQFYA